MNIAMLSMILEVGQGRPSFPNSKKNYGNHNVFKDFGGWAGGSVLPPPQNNMHLVSFPVILGIGQAIHHLPPAQNNFGNLCIFNDFGLGQAPPSPPTYPKNGRNHTVLNDFEVWAEAPITSHLPRKL